MTQLVVLILSVLGLAFTSGCGGPGGPETFSVTGSVTLQGKPLEAGMVSFENTVKGTGGAAKLESGGSFSVQLQKGDYKITVTPPLVVQDNGPETSPSEEYKKDSGINEKYWSTATSGLVVPVSAKVADHKIALE